ncbi:MAG: XRE family transcriptional regulator [Planctomycetaceae bacterium]|nr:XRE family transcriptional regulator [Planctomycetaceae bacterium]
MKAAPSYRDTTRKCKSADLADVLRAAIRDSGLSARRLGEMTDVKQQTISTILNGQADIRLSTAQRLMDYFGITVMKGK